MDKFIKFLEISTWLYAAFYFLACLTPYISPIHFPLFTFLALLFPYLLIGMFFVLILGTILLKKKSILLLLILFTGYKNIFSTIGLHRHKVFVQQKQFGTLRLLSWNVDDFVDCEKRHDSALSPMRNIFSFIKKTNADVLCFQDYSNFQDNYFLKSSLKRLVDTLKYPYYYFSVDDTFPHDYFPKRYGSIILSKFPITDSGRIAYNRRNLPEHLMYATININGRMIRFYNTHLRSMFLHWHGGDLTNNRFLIDDAAAIASTSIVEKLKHFDTIHTLQACLIKEQLNKCQLPFIFCADLNSVPSSYVYQHISNGLNDAFLQNESGWGGTYTTMPSTVRIDVVLLSNQLNATQYYSPHIQKASDHYPVVADININ